MLQRRKLMTNDQPRRIIDGIRSCGVQHRPIRYGTMRRFDESKVEYAGFAFERSKVVCYGLVNNAGGSTTVFNFPSVKLADRFQSAFLADSDFQTLQNDAQVICLTDYDTVMRKSLEDPRIRYLSYNRDFMMGTISHIT